MRIDRRLSCLLFCFFLLLGTAAAAGDTPDTAVVAYCFDGDTVKLKDRRIVRLAGIDAPETAHRNSKAQYYSRESRNTLEELVRGQQVILSFPGVNPRDRHGRLVAELSLPDGQSVNALMIERGAAFFYPHRDLGPNFQEKLKDAQRKAIEERQGLWAYMLSLPLASAHYVGNRESLRFFPAACETSGKIRPRNRVNFGTLMDAFMAGYAPARVCIFWPEAD